MPYEVTLAPRAMKFYRKCDAPLRRKLDRCFSQLEKAPREHANIRRLTGELQGYYRYRVGDHRVIYRIDEQGSIVIVALIAPRGDAYA